MRTLDGHSLVLYAGDEARLIDRVTTFLRENLALDHPVLVVASERHRHAFSVALRAKGVDPDAKSDAGLLVFLDAVTVCDLILVDGRIEWRRFDQIVGEAVRNLRMRGPLRVYGEVVDLLWSRGQHDIAVGLEGLWNRLRHKVDFELLCAYDIDIFDSTFRIDSADEIICAHGEVEPYGGSPGYALI
ncbi:MAG: MEDS domain-containing protein [Candidatus Aquilonibacter sp.]